MNNIQPIFSSPIEAKTVQTPATRAELTAVDITGVPIILLQGSPGDALDGMFANIPAVPGELVDAGSVIVARFTPDELYIFGKRSGVKLPQAAELDRQLAETGQFAHATDLTHGKAVIKLAGSAASEALTKICGLNFASAAFPTGKVQQTNAAKVKTIIARADEEETPVYFLHVERPLGQYFWDTICDAGQEFGIALASSTP